MCICAYVCIYIHTYVRGKYILYYGNLYIYIYICIAYHTLYLYTYVTLLYFSTLQIVLPFRSRREICQSVGIFFRGTDVFRILTLLTIPSSFLSQCCVSDGLIGWKIGDGVVEGCFCKLDTCKTMGSLF